MSNTMRDLISGEAELDDEEDDESFDEETGEERRRTKGARFEDSSEDEEDDDDEEEARKVRDLPLCPCDGIFLTDVYLDSRRLHRR